MNAGIIIIHPLIMQTPVSYCTITINATNSINGDTYSIKKRRMESGPSDNFMISINETELPFDSHYTTVLSVGNSYSDQMVQTPINLSRHNFCYYNYYYYIYSHNLN